MNRFRDAAASLLYRFCTRDQWPYVAEYSDGAPAAAGTQHDLMMFSCRNAITFIRHQVNSDRLVFSSALLADST